MKIDIKNRHRSVRSQNRRSIRLKEYDYTQPGLYFITVCVSHHDILFGYVVENKMILNEWGKIVKSERIKTEQLRQNVKIDKYIVMPNHFHGIIEIVDGNNGRGSTRRAPTIEKFCKPVVNSIPTIVRLFKSAVTKKINEMRETPGAKLWQRNYYEHVIRDDIDLYRVRQYILENPLKWKEDKYYI